ncbi:MAG: hypothetical protein NVS1B14_01660 [Vulcanimicrobiaceae bacterium]
MSTHSMQIALNRSVPVELAAASAHVEREALYAVHNRWLRVALLGALGACAVLAVGNYRLAERAANTRPVIVRVNELGQATAGADDSAGYAPREAELKYFLINFVQDHYSRVRTTRRDAFARQLYFLDAAHARAEVEEEQRTKSIPAFLTGADEEIEIRVLNVAFDELRAAPYKATVSFERIYRSADQRETRRERSVAHVVATVMRDIPGNFIPVNPLGLIVTYFREDRAF